jgi:hypothetical protein
MLLCSSVDGMCVPWFVHAGLMGTMCSAQVAGRMAVQHSGEFYLLRPEFIGVGLLTLCAMCVLSSNCASPTTVVI